MQLRGGVQLRSGSWAMGSVLTPWNPNKTDWKEDLRKLSVVGFSGRYPVHTLKEFIATIPV